jgi:hypothetical protein
LRAASSAAVAWLLAAAHAVGAEGPLVIGTNVDEVSYFSSALTFCNLLKEAGPWGAAFGASDVVYDATGWPTSWRDADGGDDAEIHTLMRRDLLKNDVSPPEGPPAHYPAGSYLVKCSGEGKILFGFDASGAVSCPQGGRFEVVAATEAGIQLRLQTTPNTIRDLRIYPSSAAMGCTDPAVTTFNSFFLDAFTGFQVIRFMGWLRPVPASSFEAQIRWADRHPTSHFSQVSDKGVSWEYAVELANLKGADPWLTIPVKASDDFVDGLCDYLSTALDAERSVYIEYGNEIWNSGGVFLDQQEAVDALGRGAGYRAPAWDDYQDLRSVQIWNVCRASFGAGAARVKRVLGIQNASDRSVTAERLARDVDGWGPLRTLESYTDYVAVAPYISGVDLHRGEPRNPSYEGDAARSWRPVEFHARMVADIEASLGFMSDHLAVVESRRNAEGRKLRLITYEGGQHLVGSGGAENDSQLVRALWAANADPGMEAVYSRYLEALRARGLGLFVHFGGPVSRWTKWGSWGAGEYYDTYASSPKLRALRKAMERP